MSYTIITTVSQYRMRYVVPTDYPTNDIVKAVQNGELEEFSQVHLGEIVTDCYSLDENSTLHLFDMDNEYLKEWTKEQKLDFIQRQRNRILDNADEDSDLESLDYWSKE